MKFTLSSPTRLSITDIADIAVLERLLTYRDLSVDFEIKKFKNAYWFIEKYGQEAFNERLSDLRKQQVQCLVFYDDSGVWTYSGLLPYLRRHFPQAEVVDELPRPEGRPLPWLNPPTRKPRSYQLEALEKLTAVRQGAVEIGTGLGKSFLALLLAKHYCLQTVIMAPSVSIADQLFAEFKQHFGGKYVGKYGGGRKDLGKRFTVCVAASLVRVEEGSEAWDFFSKADVFIADESHLCPAKTLAKVCFGLLAPATYRYFFSGTQMRNDGLDKLLEAITGEIVFKMTVREGVDQGYLAKPIFRMVECSSDSQFSSRDVNAVTRAFLYYNDRVNAIAADIANKSVSVLGHQVLILVDEMEQFAKLLPYLQHRVGFAHGGVTAENKAVVPFQYQKSDPGALVDEFNAGKLPILIGTSCVSTGTDIQPVKTMVYLRGGKSEIEIRQGVGRCTRKVPGKEFCNIFDFVITNSDDMVRHAEARRGVYEDIYGPVQTIRYGQC